MLVKEADLGAFIPRSLACDIRFCPVVEGVASRSFRSEEQLPGEMSGRRSDSIRFCPVVEGPASRLFRSEEQLPGRMSGQLRAQGLPGRGEAGPIPGGSRKLSNTNFHPKRNLCNPLEGVPEGVRRVGLDTLTKDSREAPQNECIKVQIQGELPYE